MLMVLNQGKIGNQGRIENQRKIKNQTVVIKNLKKYRFVKIIHIVFLLITVSNDKISIFRIIYKYIYILYINEFIRNQTITKIKIKIRSR